jgi:hypothetical protein
VTVTALDAGVDRADALVTSSPTCSASGTNGVDPP